MSNYTLADIQAAFDQAAAEEDWGAVQEYGDILDEMEGVTEAPSAPEAPSADLSSPENQELFGDLTTGQPEGWRRNLSEFAIGAGKTVDDYVSGAQELGIRTGRVFDNLAGRNEKYASEYDALTELNDRKDKENAMYERDLGDSGYAFAGGLTADIAGTAPLGMLGLAAKGGSLLKAGASVAAESAALGAIRQRGDWWERTKTAGVDGTVGLVAGAGFKYAGGKVASRFNKGAIARQVDIDAKDAAENMARAQEYGGYQQNQMDARGANPTLESTKIRETSQFGELADAENAQIKARADSFVETGLPAGASLEDGLEEASNKLFGEFRTQGSASMDEAKAAYDAVTKSTGYGVNISGKEAGEIVAGLEIRPGQGKLGDAVLAALEKRGITPDSDAWIDVKQIDEAIQDVNSFWINDSTGRAAGDNAVISRVVNGLKEFAEKKLGPIDDLPPEHPTRLAAEARDLWIKQMDTYGNDSFLGKLTAKGIGDEGWMKDPFTRVKELMKRGKASDMAKLMRAARFAGEKSPEAAQAFKEISDAPLQMAIRDSFNPQTGELNPKKMQKMIFEGMSPDVREGLWGKAKDEQMQEALETWTTRMNAPKKRNVDGTARTASEKHSLMSVIMRTGASLLTGGIDPSLLLAAPAGDNVFRGWLARRALPENIQALAAGKLPLGAQEQAIQDAANYLEEAGELPVGKEARKAFERMLSSAASRWASQWNRED